MTPIKKADIITALQSDILRLQGFKNVKNSVIDLRFGPLKDSFPGSTFPLGCIHEFLSPSIHDTAASTGFISGLLSSLLSTSGTSMWISSSRTLFPPALKNFGLDPERFVFVDLQKEKDVIWTMNEALKCGALTAVVGEMSEISFNASRSLQLAVEQSQVTGFILRKHSRKPNVTACVSRWKITSLPSIPIDDLPGIGLPAWRVELQKIRNGRPGKWDMYWQNGKLLPIQYAQQLKPGFPSVDQKLHIKKAG